MPAIVALPQVVEELLLQFGDLFPNEPSRVHFAEYLTGLIVAEHKTVSGIAREFADAPDQSCLNRWLTQAKWDVARINTHRVESQLDLPTNDHYFCRFCPPLLVDTMVYSFIEWSDNRSSHQLSLG